MPERSSSPFGRQPMYDAMKAERWTHVLLAHELGVPTTHVKNVALGWTRPKQILRDRLPEILGVPLESLFTAAALEKKFAEQPQTRRRRTVSA